MKDSQLGVDDVYAFIKYIKADNERFSTQRAREYPRL